MSAASAASALALTSGIAPIDSKDLGSDGEMGEREGVLIAGVAQAHI